MIDLTGGPSSSSSDPATLKSRFLLSHANTPTTRSTIIQNPVETMVENVPSLGLTSVDTLSSAGIPTSDELMRKGRWANSADRRAISWSLSVTTFCNSVSCALSATSRDSMAARSEPAPSVGVLSGTAVSADTADIVSLFWLSVEPSPSSPTGSNSLSATIRNPRAEGERQRSHSAATSRLALFTSGIVEKSVGRVNRTPALIPLILSLRNDAGFAALIASII